MEKRKPVVFRRKASESIAGFAWYIAEKGYPETAEKFTDRLYAFGYSLNIFPQKYPICSQPQLAKRKLRCVVFKKNYMFVYKVLRHQLVIYNVIHIKTNPAFRSI